MSNSFKDTFYTQLSTNLVSELSNSGVSLSPELLVSFINLLKNNLYKALDKTFLDLEPFFRNEEPK
jgi:hypothetical protein